MRLLIALLALGVSSAWLPEWGDPRRAGFPDAAVLAHCPARDPGGFGKASAAECGLRLYPSEPDSPGQPLEYICNNKHAYGWDDATQALVEADE